MDTVRFSPSDWKASNRIQSTSATKQRDASLSLRQSSINVRNQTSNRTEWAHADSDGRLQERHRDVAEVRRLLERTLDETEKEIDALSRERERMERVLEAKAVPSSVVIECIEKREGRRKIDLVKDEVEVQLYKELEVIEGIRSLLQQKISDAYNQLCVLQEARQQLHFDLTDKHTALSIDSECLELKNDSAGTGFYPNSTRTDKHIVTPDTWSSFSNYNILRAKAEMKASLSLREAAGHLICQTSADLESQRLATEYAFRKRVHEMKQAIDELEWQDKNTSQEIVDTQKEADSLMRSIQEKHPPMMVAQTRLENRTNRPHVELCLDTAQFTLVDEVSEISGALQSLIQQLDSTRNMLDTLHLTLNRVRDDLDVKKTSFDIDTDCLKSREQLTAPGMKEKHLGKG